MEIAYIWINDFRNLKNLSFNLGSEYIYDFEFRKSEQKASLSRKKNENYIKDLYAPLLNISAIVGKNASGKSSVIEALRQIAQNKRRDYLEFFILFQENDSLYYDSFLGYKSDTEKYEFEMYLDVDISFVNFEKDPVKSDRKNYQTIFFSQIIDLNIYPMNHDSQLGIDISSNWLSFSDMQSNSADTNIRGLDYHKHCETLRQIQFVQQFNEQSNIV
ncbi:MAG: ATP-binding protein, partial [Bacteroidales bacterium]|nr:ATP-binding protein [Bacteroidales bacterium]